MVLTLWGVILGVERALSLTHCVSNIDSNTMPRVLLQDNFLRKPATILINVYSNHSICSSPTAALTTVDAVEPVEA